MPPHHSGSPSVVPLAPGWRLCQTTSLRTTNIFQWDFGGAVHPAGDHWRNLAVSLFSHEENVSPWGPLLETPTLASVDGISRNAEPCCLYNDRRHGSNRFVTLLRSNSSTFSAPFASAILRPAFVMALRLRRVGLRVCTTAKPRHVQFLKLGKKERWTSRNLERVFSQCYCHRVGSPTF
jgi:hypothetical protein